MNLTQEERSAGALSQERVAEALLTFRDTGLVVLENLLDAAWVAEVQAAYNRALEARIAAKGGLGALQQTPTEKNHLSFYPPLIAPFSDPRIIANPLALQVMEALLGKDLQCNFYHSNTSYPGSEKQNVHRDAGHLFGTTVPGALPVTHIALNVPLCDFTEANGSTEIWPGTHLIVDANGADGRRLNERVEGLPSTRTNISAGSLVLRDMRMWHRGMPNATEAPRTMLALIYRRGWLTERTILNIPQATWDGWPERAHQIFRGNHVTP